MRPSELVLSLAGARKGDEIVYWRGALARERELSADAGPRNVDAHTVAEMAWYVGAPTVFLIGARGSDRSNVIDVSGQGAAFLFQRRTHFGIEYVLKMRRRLTKDEITSLSRLAQSLPATALRAIEAAKEAAEEAA